MSNDGSICWNGRRWDTDQLTSLKTGLTEERQIAQAILDWNQQDAFTFHTSGSTGTPKEITFTKKQVKASIQLTQDSFGLTDKDVALLALPMKYVAGKMMLYRALEIGMDLVSVESKIDLSAHLNKKVSFAALIPLQVEYLLKLEGGRKWLEGINTVLIGGGKVSPDIKSELASFTNNIYHTYGMTETLTHVAIRLLSRGGSTSFAPLSGIHIDKGQEKNLIVHADHLNIRLSTNDLVDINDDGTFRVLGRLDNVINSGGLKIIPEPIEQRIRVLLNRDVVIVGLPHASLGEKVCLIVEGEEINDRECLESALNKIPRNQRPKEIFFLPELLKTESGKLRRNEMKVVLSSL